MRRLSKVGLALTVGVIVYGATISLIAPSVRTPAPTRAQWKLPVSPRPQPRPARPAGTPAAGSTSAPSAPAPSPFVDALRRHERVNNWVELGVLALSDVPDLSPADRRGAIELLARHSTNGGFPALFAVAHHQWLLGDKEAACRSFIKASVVGVIDAQRCTDATARQAVSVIRARFGPLAAHLKTLPRETTTAWTREALDFEESIADREPARWIAAHGIKAAFAPPGGAADAAFLPDEEWAAARERARASIVGSLPK